MGEGDGIVGILFETCPYWVPLREAGNIRKQVPNMG
jgi:hypothetical protein